MAISCHECVTPLYHRDLSLTATTLIGITSHGRFPIEEMREIDATSYRGRLERYFVFKRLMTDAANQSRAACQESNIP